MITFNRYLDTIYMIVDGVNVGKIRIEDEGKPSLFIPLLKINKKHRKKGYGHYLMSYVIQEYNHQESISLYVSVYNPNAISLYRKCGFFISLLRNGDHPHYLMTYRNSV